MGELSGGFSGKFDDLRDLPELPQGFSAAEIAEFMGDNAAFHERSDLEQSLNAWNFDYGFIDIYYNQDKISSSSNLDIATGTSPSIKLKSDLETVESGGTTLNYEGTSSFSVVQNEIDGDYSLKFTDNGGVYKDLSTISNSDGDVYILDIKPITLSGGTIQIALDNTAGGQNVITMDNYDSSGSGLRVEYNTIKSDAFTVGETTKIKLELDYTNDAVDVYVDGTLQASAVAIDIDATQIDSIGYNSNAGGDAYYIDNFSYKYDNGGATASSGSLTQTRKVFDSTPSKLVANPEYNLNGQSLELVVEDNSGNSVTIPESDFGTEVLVSFDDADTQTTVNFSGDGVKTPELLKNKVIGVS